MQNTDSMKDEIRLQREKLNGQPFHKKWEYYWGYYKVPAIIILLAACMVGSIFHTILTRKETVLSVAYINAFPNVDDTQFMSGFNSYLGINSGKQDTSLDSGFYLSDNPNNPYTATYAQKLSAMAMAGKLDVAVADEYYFASYANQGFFQDLTPLLSEAQMVQYQDSFYYCDLPDDNIPQAVPVGINVTNASRILETASYPNTIAYYGIVAGSQYTDNALSFLSYLESAP
ncbi:MAG: extracellular solute-binding protein [Lachnospiraceae bacterium]|nr:extracellular solute-binding protein [Lachnospiraceae bacterium]MDD7027357.1 extracellular solute-binding protein [Lachnospiraceae bacterium]MDY5700044.1 hypothetical protein [Lachnospiraceae bacterium]